MPQPAPDVPKLNRGARLQRAPAQDAAGSDNGAARNAHDPQRYRRDEQPGLSRLRAIGAVTRGLRQRLLLGDELVLRRHELLELLPQLVEGRRRALDVAGLAQGDDLTR